MEEYTALLDKAKEVAAKISETTSVDKNTLIVGHLDADGIASSSLLAKTFQRQNHRFTVRILGELTPKVLKNIVEEDYEYHFLCELGGGLVDQIESFLGEKWLLVDHHQVPEEELMHENVFNAWRFRLDGSRDISTTGMMYLVSKAISLDNIDLSWLTVVAALADRQDQGSGRSMLSLNNLILKEAVSQGLVNSFKDLAFYGRETRPIHEAISSTTTPFLVGLTDNSDACLATLKAAGIELKSGDRWRTVSELSEDEKKKLVEAIIPHVVSEQSPEDALGELIANVYLLTREDDFSPLRDAREFGTLLNACGRMKRGSVGVALCMGERGEYLSEARRILSDYRKALHRCINLMQSEGRLMVRERFVSASGIGVVEEDMLGVVASILSSTPELRDKMLVADTSSGEDGFKVSARRPSGMVEVNLGELLRAAALSVGGSGGGHSVAAGARIPKEKRESFLKFLDKELTVLFEGKGQVKREGS